MDRPTIIEVARRAGGLTQAELARRAGTSQPTLSAYERGLKSPSLKVTERIMQAAGYDLAMTTMVRFDAVFETRITGFLVPDRLWRVDVPNCFGTVFYPDRVHGTDQYIWNLHKRDHRRGLYENLLSEGTARQLIDWLDGALLVDLWPELDIRRRIRREWDPLIQNAVDGPFMRG